MISFERSTGQLCGRPMPWLHSRLGPWLEESSQFWLYLRYGVYTCTWRQRDRRISAHVIDYSAQVSDYCVYFKRWPQNRSGLNARKLRPAWLTADLALLDANIVSHTWLIYLHSNKRREATTYIKHVFTFDRFQAVTATKWGRRAGGEDMHLWLLLGRHHGADSHSISLSLSQSMLLFKDMCVVLMASWLLPQSRVRNVKSTVSRMRP